MNNGSAVFRSKEEMEAYAKEFKVKGRAVIRGDGYEFKLSNGKYLTLDNK